jgi:hypothetical protein
MSNLLLDALANTNLLERVLAKARRLHLLKLGKALKTA